MPILAIAIVVAARADAAPWQHVASVRDVVDAWPERVARLFDALDLERPGLAAVRAAWETGDATAAGEALLAYYRTADPGSWLREREPTHGGIGEDALREANETLEDIYYGFGDQGKLPRRDDGHLDWSHRGPNHDRQFALRVNRHGFLQHLLTAYQVTGETTYIQRLDQDLRDWLIAADGQVVPYHQHTSLEPSLRLPTWARVFYALQDEPHVQPATRLLMLMTLPDHAEYIWSDLKRNHNWATMQLNGLGTLGLAFPEFKQADTWWRRARDNMAREIQRQIYPDGAQTELTFGYHMVALNRFKDLMETAIAAGQAMDGDYRDGIEAMFHYVAQVVRPNGTGPLNNNSDLLSVTSHLLNAAAMFDRPDWRYIASRGAEGVRPDAPSSRFLPWAGQLISRSGWDAKAHWSFFDIGPHGSNRFHAHSDKLHLSVHAYGRDLLVDTGRFAYTGTLAERFGSYAKHSRSQNVILIDGCSQGPGEDRARNPIGEDRYRITDEHDWAMGHMDNFEHLEGKVVHTRAVHYQRGEFWLVVDRIESDRPRTIQPLWHFHPDCAVEIIGEAVRSADADASNIIIVPVNAADWKVELIRGQEKPYPMGWYSPTYGEALETTVARYEASIDGGTTTFAWLILPAQGEAPPATLELLGVEAGCARLRVSIDAAAPRELSVSVEPITVSGRRNASPRSWAGHFSSGMPRSRCARTP